MSSAQNPIPLLANLIPLWLGTAPGPRCGRVLVETCNRALWLSERSTASPPDVSSVVMTQSQTSVNGVQHRAVDGTRIPILGQKAFDVELDQGSALSQILQIAELQAADLRVTWWMRS